MDEIQLTPGECHTITFKTSEIQANFRQLLTDYFSNKKQAEWNYIKILNNNRKKIKGKDLYFIQFDCHAIQLKNERDTEKQIREILHYQLENNPGILNDFIIFNEQLQKFFSSIEIVNGELIVDVQPSNKTISQLIKSLEITIEFQNQDFVPNYIMRDFLIKSLLQMNMLNKDVFLLISYPEADVGLGDFQVAMEYLTKLNVTTLIISANSDFLTSVPEENIFLINENGEIYDILTLKDELQKFKIAQNDDISTISKRLAFYDFKQQYYFLNKKYKEFLLSDRV